MAETQTRRKDTRQRIQDVALELFLEYGYEGTSLRKIAERLEVTKAALYYHFNSKEDIVVSFFERFGAPIDELIAWAQGEPRTVATRLEMLSRLNAVLMASEPFVRFTQENQAALRGLRNGDDLKTRMEAMSGLLVDEGDELVDQIRGVSALLTVFFGSFAVRGLKGTPDEKRAALLQVACELLAESRG